MANQFESSAMMSGIAGGLTDGLQMAMKVFGDMQARHRQDKLDQQQKITMMLPFIKQSGENMARSGDAAGAVGAFNQYDQSLANLADDPSVYKANPMAANIPAAATPQAIRAEGEKRFAPWADQGGFAGVEKADPTTAKSILDIVGGQLNAPHQAASDAANLNVMTRLGHAGAYGTPRDMGGEMVSDYTDALGRVDPSKRRTEAKSMTPEGVAADARAGKTLAQGDERIKQDERFHKDDVDYKNRALTQAKTISGDEIAAQDRRSLVAGILGLGKADLTFQERQQIAAQREGPALYKSAMAASKVYESRKAAYDAKVTGAMKGWEAKVLKLQSDAGKGGSEGKTAQKAIATLMRQAHLSNPDADNLSAFGDYTRITPGDLAYRLAKTELAKSLPVPTPEGSGLTAEIQEALKIGPEAFAQIAASRVPVEAPQQDVAARLSPYLNMIQQLTGQTIPGAKAAGGQPSGAGDLAGFYGGVQTQNEDDHRKRHGGGGSASVDDAVPIGTPVPLPSGAAGGIITGITSDSKSGNYVTFKDIQTGKELGVMHLGSIEPGLRIGMKVNQGVPIGTAGRTGNVQAAPGQAIIHTQIMGKARGQHDVQDYAREVGLPSGFMQKVKKQVKTNAG